jgi:hypothetical protein
MLSMDLNQELSSAALEFVNLLTPGSFDAACEWLAENCEYSYGDQILRGKEIIQSFKGNHEAAAKKLDMIEYQNAEIETVEGLSVSVLVTGRISVGSRIYDYKDRLIVTFESDIEIRSVVRIENLRVEGEREKLLSFFRSCGIEWK